MTELLETFPLLLLGILVITQLIKKWIKPKLGDTGVQVFIALLAFLFAGIWLSKDFFTKETVDWMVKLWITANGAYQVLFKWLVLGIYNKAKELVIK